MAIACECERAYEFRVGRLDAMEDVEARCWLDGRGVSCLPIDKHVLPKRSRGGRRPTLAIVIVKLMLNYFSVVQQCAAVRQGQ